MSFPPLLRGFLAKNEKTSKVGKFRKYDEETEYFEKRLKRFHLYQNGKAENMLVVAGRLVYF